MDNIKVKPTLESPPAKKKRFKAPESPPQNQNSLLEDQKSLPIFPARDKIIQEVRKAETVIIIGETASGKTTQIPQYLLRSGFAKAGCIGCTQPRRVAAITIAQRCVKNFQ